jgi:type IV pilus assembly protein PilV
MFAIKNNEGFTLIEFMVAVVILMVGLLGLLQTVNMAISTNKVNQLRNEAVIAADQEITRQLQTGYDQIVTPPAGTKVVSVVSRPILNGFKNYSVFRSGTDFSNSKQVIIQVTWNYKNVTYTHDASAIISKK